MAGAPLAKKTPGEQAVRTPFSIEAANRALYAGDIAQLRAWVQDGSLNRGNIDANTGRMECTLLLRALSNAANPEIRLDAARLFLDAGANPDVCDAVGRHSSLYFYQFDFIYGIDKLLEHGWSDKRQMQLSVAMVEQKERPDLLEVFAKHGVVPTDESRAEVAEFLALRREHPSPVEHVSFFDGRITGVVVHLEVPQIEEKPEEQPAKKGWLRRALGRVLRTQPPVPPVPYSGKEPR